MQRTIALFSSLPRRNGRLLKRFSSSKCLESESSAAENVDVAIVGGGVGAASTALHLARLTNSSFKIKVIEAGKVGIGAPARQTFVSGTAVPDSNTWSVGSVGQPPAGMQQRLGLAAKMVLTSFPTSAQEFTRMHGYQGAVLAHEISSLGLKMQTQLAKSVLPDPAKQFRQLGTVYLAREAEVATLEQDYRIWTKLGANVHLMRKDELATMPGVPDDIVAGLYFRDDAIINSSLYSASLLRVCSKRVSVMEDTSVVEIRERKARRGRPGHVTLVLDSGKKIRAKYAVVATGGYLSQSLDVAQFVKPCWSFLVTLPFAPDGKSQLPQFKHAQEDKGLECSPNFVQLCDAPYDWALVDGQLRLSGEDRHSAFTAPQADERWAKLRAWAVTQFPHLATSFDAAKLKQGAQLFGLYSETPDLLPLVGKFSSDSNVAYLIGCNAIGQATLSFGAHLLPGVLGLRPLSTVEKTLADFLSPQRATLRPVVMASSASGGLAG